MISVSSDCVKEKETTVYRKYQNKRFIEQYQKNAEVCLFRLAHLGAFLSFDKIEISLIKQGKYATFLSTKGGIYYDG